MTLYCFVDSTLENSLWKKSSLGHFHGSGSPCCGRTSRQTHEPMGYYEMQFYENLATKESGCTEFGTIRRIANRDWTSIHILVKVATRSLHHGQPQENSIHCSGSLEVAPRVYWLHDKAAFKTCWIGKKHRRANPENSIFERTGLDCSGSLEVCLGGIYPKTSDDTERNTMNDMVPRYIDGRQRLGQTRGCTRDESHEVGIQSLGRLSIHGRDLHAHCYGIKARGCTLFELGCACVTNAEGCTSHGRNESDLRYCDANLWHQYGGLLIAFRWFLMFNQVGVFTIILLKTCVFAIQRILFLNYAGQSETSFADFGWQCSRVACISAFCFLRAVVFQRARPKQLVIAGKRRLQRVRRRCQTLRWSALWMGVMLSTAHAIDLHQGICAGRTLKDQSYRRTVKPPIQENMTSLETWHGTRMMHYRLYK